MSPSEVPRPLVSTAWLADHLADKNIRILDASWYLPAAGRNAPAEYLSAHIPGALFFDLDAISDPGTALPHMLPSPDQFSRDAGSLGVGDETFVVVYDSSGLNMSAPRVWWMFRAFGHEEVAVLDGGLGKWRTEGRPLESGTVSAMPQRFTASAQGHMVRDLESIVNNLKSGREQVLDARSAGRFAGTESEPRAGLCPGHIPGSRSLPFNRLVRPDGTILAAADLRSRFEESGIILTQPVVATCGSGTTACALLLGLHVLGHREVALYDGSWSEWGGRSDTPIETGLVAKV